MEIKKSGTWVETGVLEITSWSKPTNQQIPLHHSSAHHVQIHHAWPMQRLKHFESLCTTSTGAAIASARFISELVNKAAGHVAIPALFAHVAGNTPLSSAPRSKLCSWLVLPFHVAFESCGIAKSLFELEKVWPSAFVHLFPRLSWRLVEPNVQTVMQKHLSKLCQTTQQ